MQQINGGKKNKNEKGSGHSMQFRGAFNYCPRGFLGGGIPVPKETASLKGVFLHYFCQSIAANCGEMQNVLFISPTYKINTYENTNTI